MDLKDKTALVTGASKGIGAATAVALTREGTRVMLVYKSDKPGANKTLNECQKHIKDCHSFVADLTDEKQVAVMLSKIKRLYQRVDILVNSAGIFDPADSPDNIASFERIYRTNFFSQVQLISQVLCLMKKGKIINVTSVHGRLGHGRPETIAYSAFKAAFDSYTKNLAKHLAPNILVNAVAPGKVLTPMWGNLSFKEKKELGATQLINRFIGPAEIADSILFLLKNDAMCGEILTIDGGMSLKTLG